MWLWLKIMSHFKAKKSKWVLMQNAFDAHAKVILMYKIK